MVQKKKNPLDYLHKRDELVPLQIRLPATLAQDVKAKLARHGLTFTDLVKGACHWYLNEVDTTYNPILDKKSSGDWARKK